MMVFLLILYIVVSLGTLTLLYMVVRGRNKRRLLGDTHGASCDAPDCIGVSVLCSGVKDIAQVENLLSAEYSRYEVVVVLDARRYPKEFDELAARYRMIRVEYVPTWEFPVFGVRELGRSRKRSFRRLVLIDRAQDTPAGDFDAAASVATYDYVLPLCEGQYLMPDAIERLVAEAGERPAGELALVRSWIGEPLAMFSREAVIAAGGFTRKPVRRIPYRRRRILWEPLGCGRGIGCPAPWLAWLLFGLLLAGIVVAAAVGRWPLAALLVTAALVWAAAGYARQAVAEVAGPCFAGLVAWRRYLRK